MLVLSVFSPEMVGGRGMGGGVGEGGDMDTHRELAWKIILASMFTFYFQGGFHYQGGELDMFDKITDNILTLFQREIRFIVGFKHSFMLPG